jgi:hypothetical protein
VELVLDACVDRERGHRGKTAEGASGSLPAAKTPFEGTPPPFLSVEQGKRERLPRGDDDREQTAALLTFGWHEARTELYALAARRSVAALLSRGLGGDFHVRRLFCPTPPTSLDHLPAFDRHDRELRGACELREVPPQRPAGPCPTGL